MFCSHKCHINIMQSLHDSSSFPPCPITGHFLLEIACVIAACTSNCSLMILWYLLLVLLSSPLPLHILIIINYSLLCHRRHSHWPCSVKIAVLPSLFSPFPQASPPVYIILSCHHCTIAVDGDSNHILAHTCDTDDSTPTVTGVGILDPHAAVIFAICDQGLTKWMDPQQPPHSNSPIHHFSLKKLWCHLWDVHFNHFSGWQDQPKPPLHRQQYRGPDVFRPWPNLPSFIF